MENDKEYKDAQEQKRRDEWVHSELMDSDEQNNVPDFISFNPTKANIKATGVQLLKLIDEGVENPLKIAQIKKFFADVFESIEKDLRSHVLDSMSENKETVFGGTRFEPMESGTKYAYDKCGDTYYNWLAQEKKDREAILKALKSPTELVDKNSGEINVVYPPLKTSTSTYKVIFE